MRPSRRTPRHAPDWVRALALERVRELKRSGWTYREIARTHGWNGAGAVHVPQADVDVAFASALNTVAQGMAFYDLSGALVYRNRWLHQTLQLPTGKMLADALADFVCETRKIAGQRQIIRETQVERLHEKEVSGALLPVRRLSGSLVAYDLFGVGPTLMVGVDSTPVVLPTPEDAKKRFGLTRTETRVAYHLVDGLRTDEIADTLCLPHAVVRRQTERVLGKLGAPSRAEIVLALTRAER